VLPVALDRELGISVCQCQMTLSAIWISMFVKIELYQSTLDLAGLLANWLSTMHQGIRVDVYKDIIVYKPPTTWMP